MTYDKEGAVIDRRAPNWLENHGETCWTDPAGVVVYGTRGPDCRPAHPWP